MKKKITGLLAVLAITGWTGTASAATIDVALSFEDSDWSGSFSYDDTSGVAWTDNSLITAYTLTAFSVTQLGVATWDFSELVPGYLPPAGGALVDGAGTVAWYSIAYDTAIELGIGASVSVSDSIISQSYITGVSGDVLYTASPSAVPLPAAAWLFGSAILGLVGIARRKQA